MFPEHESMIFHPHHGTGVVKSNHTIKVVRRNNTSTGETQWRFVRHWSSESGKARLKEEGRNLSSIKLITLLILCAGESNLDVCMLVEDQQVLRKDVSDALKNDHLSIA